MATKQKKEKAVMGRPTDYLPSHVQKVWDYLKTVGREQTRLAKIVDIALLLGVDENTITQWGKEYPDFSRALSAVKATQKTQLMDDAFYGGREINSNVGIFLLNANHGMHKTERFEGEIKATPYENLSDEELDALLEKKFGAWQRDKEQTKKLLEAGGSNG